MLENFLTGGAKKDKKKKTHRKRHHKAKEESKKIYKKSEKYQSNFKQLKPEDFYKKFLYPYPLTSTDPGYIKRHLPEYEFRSNYQDTDLFPSAIQSSLFNSNLPNILTGSLFEIPKFSPYDIQMQQKTEYIGPYSQKLLNKDDYEKISGGMKNTHFKPFLTREADFPNPEYLVFGENK